MHSLIFRNMSKAYGDVDALKDVALTLQSGRVHALMGEMEEFAGHMEVCNAIFAVNLANREAEKGGAV